MKHYFPEDKRSEFMIIAAANAFTGPCFTGQGLTRSVGNDCYGHFIVEIKTLKNGKPVVGLVSAGRKFVSDWTKGDMTCSLPGDRTDPKDCKPTEWITVSGKKKSGKPKWWYCDENGKKINGAKADFSWNGAYGYRSPEF